MGMDLISAGFTVDGGVVPDVVVLQELLGRLTWTEEQLLQIEPSGGYDTEEIADLLLEGAATYVDVVENSHRMSTEWFIPDTRLVFYLAGGGSWGDDPFDGFSSLLVFLEACNRNAELAEAAGYVDAGIPSPSTQTRYWA